MNDKDIDTIGSLAVGTVFTVIGTAILLVVGGMAVQHFWNGVMPQVFSLKSLTYSEAFSLMALVYLARFQS